jgi:hypothetical protein
MNDVQKVLVGAHRFFQRYDWLKGKMMTTDDNDYITGGCLLGALAYGTAAVNPDDGALFDAVVTCIQGASGIHDLGAWNDAQERDLTDIVALLNLTYERAK